MIVPHYNRRVWKLQVPRGLVFFLCSLGIIIFAIGSLGIWKYTVDLQIRKTNLVLVEELNRVRETLQRLSSLDRQLRIMAGLEVTSEDKIGIGGVEKELGILTSIKEASEEIENIKSEVKRNTSNFQETENWLQGKKDFLQKVPSIWPVKGWVTSEFGERVSPFTGVKEFHEGIDIVNQIGTAVVAPADGVVTQAGQHPVYGNTLTISHGYGYTTFYGHLSRTATKSGQKVKRGEIIAWLGNTGRSTGPHLHYEVRINNVVVNPRFYMLDGIPFTENW